MKDPARTWNAVVLGEDTPCWSVTRRHERLKTCGARRGEVLPPRLLREPQQAALDRRVRCRRNTGLAQHAQTVQLARSSGSRIISRSAPRSLR